MGASKKTGLLAHARHKALYYSLRRRLATGSRVGSYDEESEMGILDFLSKKPAAPAPAGASETSAASADALKAEISKLGLDASKVEVAVDGSTVTLSGSAPTTADAEKIALAVGNTQGVTKVVNNIAAESAHAGSGFYTVKSGDSLWKIAEAVYGHGHGAKYEEIFEANKPMLKDPDRIFPGQVLRIPTASDGTAPQAAAAPPASGDDIVWKAPTT
jgi:nucleoid-associated protein YgaU